MHHWTFYSKKVLKSSFFYDNRNLKISKSKKLEQYCRDKIEIFIRLFDEHFARRFESHWSETWRHTGRRTVPQISLETPPPSPASRCCFKETIHFRLRWNRASMRDVYLSTLTGINSLKRIKWNVLAVKMVSLKKTRSGYVNVQNVAQRFACLTMHPLQRLKTSTNRLLTSVSKTF